MKNGGQAQHNAEVAKVRDEVANAQEDLNAKNARMAKERVVVGNLGHLWGHEPLVIRQGG